MALKILSIEPTFFLLIYGGVVTLLIGSFLIIKKRMPRPSRLNLKAESTKLKSDLSLTSREEPQNSRTRQLNVIFMFNGEAWDAFEILGLPAGSSLDAVHYAYKTSIQELEENEREFFNAAYQAILIQHK